MCIYTSANCPEFSLKMCMCVVGVFCVLVIVVILGSHGCYLHQKTPTLCHKSGV